MTFSSLISGTIPNNNKYSSRHGVPVTRVIQHHFAGTSDERLRGTAQASASYIIYNDGSIWGHIPEEFRPWTSGSFEADGGAITYEVQNSSFQVNGNDDDPASWQVSEAAYNSIIRLTADIAARHGFGAVTPTNYQGHRQWFATACPGGFLWNRMDNTRAQANVILSGGGDPQLLRFRVRRSGSWLMKFLPATTAPEMLVGLPSAISTMKFRQKSTVASVSVRQLLQSSRSLSSPMKFSPVLTAMANSVRLPSGTSMTKFKMRSIAGLAVAV